MSWLGCVTRNIITTRQGNVIIACTSISNILEMRNRLTNDHWCKSLESSKTFCLKTKMTIKTFLSKRSPRLIRRPEGASRPRLWTFSSRTSPTIATQRGVSRGVTSHSTLYRSFRGRFLQARWPNQQRQSTEGSQWATEIGFSPPEPHHWVTIIMN